MKHLISFVLALLGVSAYGRTTVSDTLYRADGTTCAGQISLSWDTFTSTGGQLIQAGRLTTTVTAGALSVSLEPGTYRANYQLIPSNCLPASETWVVPTSGTPVPLSGVRALRPPPAASLIPPAWLGQSGATTGEALIWDGSAWSPGAAVAGGVNWGLIGGTLSSQTDLNTALGGKEPALGNPDADGYVLSSTAAGVRSWVAALPGCTNDGAGNLTCASFTAILGGPSSLTEQAAPVGTPAAGTLSEWADSTDHTLKWQDSSGNITQPYRNQSCASGSHISAANADGTFSCTADTGGTGSVTKVAQVIPLPVNVQDYSQDATSTTLRTLWLGMASDDSNKPETGFVMGARRLPALRFPSTNLATVAGNYFALPSSWDGGTVTAHITWSSLYGTTGGTVIFTVSTTCGSTETPTYHDGTSSAVTLAANSTLYHSTATMDMTGCAASADGTSVQIKLLRSGGTLADDKVDVTMVSVEYLANLQ